MVVTYFYIPLYEVLFKNYAKEAWSLGFSSRHINPTRTSFALSYAF